MYSANTLFLAIIIALAVGLGIGVLATRRISADARKQRELERDLEKALDQQRNYQLEVSEHFSDTGKLLGTLAESYRNVHNHLAEGAGRLAAGNNEAVLAPLPELTPKAITAAPVNEQMQQPLDYAPKASPYEPGMLNEEFGLDKIEPEPVPDTVIDSQPLPEEKV